MSIIRDLSCSKCYRRWRSKDGLSVEYVPLWLVLLLLWWSSPLLVERKKYVDVDPVVDPPAPDPAPAPGRLEKGLGVP